jgi:hypothetical protein
MGEGGQEEGGSRGLIGAAAEEARQAIWLAMREFSVPNLGEKEFNQSP